MDTVAGEAVQRGLDTGPGEVRHRFASWAGRSRSPIRLTRTGSLWPGIRVLVGSAAGWPHRARSPGRRV